MKYSYIRNSIFIVLIFCIISSLSCASADGCDIRQLPAEEQQMLYIMGEIYETEGNPKAAAIAFGKAGNYSNARERSFKLWDTVLYRRGEGDFWGNPLSLRYDGSVYMFDSENSYPDLVEELNNERDVIQIVYGALCCSDFDSAFLRKDGTAFSTDDKCEAYSNLSSVVKLTDGDFALLCDGRVINIYTQETLFEDIADVIGFSYPRWFAYAFLRLDGTVNIDYLRFTEESRQKIAALSDVVSLGYVDDDFIFYCENGAVYSFNTAHELEAAEDSGE